MGYQIMVEPGVQVYVEDLNPQGAHTILFLHGWPLNGNAYSTSWSMCPRWAFGASRWTRAASGVRTGRGTGTTTTALRTTCAR